MGKCLVQIIFLPSNQITQKTLDKHATTLSEQKLYNTWTSLIWSNPSMVSEQNKIGIDIDL